MSLPAGGTANQKTTVSLIGVGFFGSLTVLCWCQGVPVPMIYSGIFFQSSQFTCFFTNGKFSFAQNLGKKASLMTVSHTNLYRRAN